MNDKELIDHIKYDYTKANLTTADRALLDYTVKLTREPSSVTSKDVENLRAQGFSDRAILDACQVISYFNYINRIADGLGVDLEDFMKS